MPTIVIDETIRARFGELHRRLAEAAPSMSLRRSAEALAAIIVFDQFSRNMFRGSRGPSPPTAGAIRRRQCAGAGFDAAAAEQRRHFFYMPFMHSETPQTRSAASRFLQRFGGDNVKYAIEHRDIIARFGRFPHRNRVLGRETTAAEQAFLSPSTRASASNGTAHRCTGRVRHDA